MIKPHGSDELNPLYVYNAEQRHALLAEAEELPSLLVNSAAAANAVMLAGGYFNPLTGYMNLADALSVAEKMHTVDGLFFPGFKKQQVKSPIVLIGNPRTGTTFLQTLLHTDPTLRALELWELQSPVPVAADPRTDRRRRIRQDLADVGRNPSEERTKLAIALRFSGCVAIMASATGMALSNRPRLM